MTGSRPGLVADAFGHGREWAVELGQRWERAGYLTAVLRNAKGHPQGRKVTEQLRRAAESGEEGNFGLLKQKAPLNIRNSFGSFYIGEGAHDWGRPVESLDIERNNGTPEAGCRQRDLR